MEGEGHSLCHPRGWLCGFHSHVGDQPSWLCCSVLWKDNVAISAEILYNHSNQHWGCTACQVLWTVLGGIITLILRWKNWGTAGLNNILNVTQLQGPSNSKHVLKGVPFAASTHRGLGVPALAECRLKEAGPSKGGGMKPVYISKSYLIYSFLHQGYQIKAV